jgi:general secretion pathway protein B
MSFILDALKKSENERQRQAGPALATAPSGSQEESSGQWLTILLVAMAVVIAILAVMLLRGGTSEPPPTATTQVPSATVIAPQVPPPTTTPAARETSQSRGVGTQAPVAARERNLRSLRDEVATSTAAETSTAPVATPGAQPNQPRTATPQPTAAATITAVPTNRSSDVSRLPTARDLILQGRLSGPPLHLDLHIYSDDPARRAVFVNGDKYREGDQIGNGPRVQEIVPEGAVLDDGFQLFLLAPD